MYRHEPAPMVVVAGQPMVQGGVQPGVPVVIEQPAHGFFYYAVTGVSIVLTIVIVVALIGAFL